MFVTNNSSQPVGEVEAKLAAHGIPADGDVITSAMAAAALVEPGERVLVCAGPGVVEALERRGAVPVRDGDADAVLVGFHRDFDYERLRIAARAVRRGARLLATNDDSSYPTPDGPIPGGGAILAAVVDRDRRRAGGGREAARTDGRPGPRSGWATHGVMVGDRPDTDGLLRPGARLPLRARPHRGDPGRRAGRPGARPRGARPARPWSTSCSANSCKHLTARS